MKNNVQREIKILKMYSIGLSLLVLIILISSFSTGQRNMKFDEIDVERINIVESDGKIMMVISNKARQHPGMLDGKEFDPRERAPGMLFFNEEQDEVGGLTYSGNKEEGANLILSVDQYKNDQVMQFMHYTNNEGNNRYGLQLWERDKDLSLPDILFKMDSLEKEGYAYRAKLKYLREQNGGKPINEPRMFVGKNYNSETGMFIQDQNGTERLRFYVDSSNQPRIEVLDTAGNVERNILDF